MLFLGKLRFQGAFIRPIDSLDSRNTLLFCFCLFACLLLLLLLFFTTVLTTKFKRKIRKNNVGDKSI